MGDRLRHRGAKVVRPVCVGNTILGGIADSDSAQPYSATGFDVVCDADLFNAGEILDQIRAADGDESDPSHVVGEAIACWGSAAFAKLSASFAAAIHDQSDGSLTLARDWAGARGLYYVPWQGGIAFASEYKALLSLPGIGRNIDRQALQHLSSRKTLPANRTLIEGIRQVPAGSSIQFKGDQAGEPVRFWKPEVAVAEGDLSFHANQVCETFLQTMEKRAGQMDPLAVSLSGGIDSIAMVAALRRLYPNKRLLTFSVGDRSDDPELVWAQRVADRFQTEHHGIVCSAERLRSELPSLVWHLEDPLGRTETLLGFCLAREISKHCSAVFRGDAADGLFGGMPRHKILAWAQQFPPLRSALSQVYSFTQTGVMPTRVAPRLLVGGYFRGSIAPPTTVLGAQPPQALAPFPGNHGAELLNHVTAQGSIESVPTMLSKVDRTHAAFAVRGICPFVDQEMVACGYRVPSKFKHNGKRNKIVWREAMSQLLPSELSNRPKFPQRIKESKSFCNELAGLAEPLLTSARANARGLYDESDVSKLLVRDKSGVWPPEHAMRLWTLLLVEIWARLFVDQDGGAEAARGFEFDVA